MKASQYMDKQIMDLSASGSPTHTKNFLDLMNQPSLDGEEDQERDRHIVGGENGINKEAIVPSYDFQPIRPLVAPPLTQNLDGASRAWSSADSKPNSSAAPIRNYSSISIDTIEPAKVVLEKDRNTIDAAQVVDEVDRTMKKYTDTLLHVLEGVSTRLTQLESRTYHIEISVDELKVSVENNQGNTQGKMQHLENILREVQTGVQVLKDKQDIVETQIQLAKLQVAKVDPQIDSVHQSVSTPQAQQSHQLPPNEPPPPAQQNIAPPVQAPYSFPQNQLPSVPQREPYFPPPGQTPEVPNQQYQLPPAQQHLLPPAQQAHTPLPSSLPHQQYQPVPQQQYPQTTINDHHQQPQSSLGHRPEEPPYVPSQTYSPTQQFYGPPSHVYDPPATRPTSGFSSGYNPPSGPSESYPYGGMPLPVKPHQLSSSPAVAQGGGSGYPQLPTARVLPQAVPTASGVGTGSGSAGSGNRVPVDDVIDKVTTMGFPRDHVRATVRKLTENGQSVDLNVVLDKLMNDGEVQPQRGWPFDR